MESVIWSIVAGIVSGLFAGTISARIAVNRLSQRLSDGSQMATGDGMIQRDNGVQVRNYGQYASGTQATNVGRDEYNIRSNRPD